MNTGKWDNSKRYNIEDQQGLDTWLRNYIGYENYCEWWPVSTHSFTTRTFSFREPKHATIFLIKWQ